MPAFGIFTSYGLADASLDLVTQDKPSATKHKRELIKDFGFDFNEVKIVEMPDESAIYRIVELIDEKGVSFAKALKEVHKEIAAPVEAVEVQKIAAYNHDPIGFHAAIKAFRK